MTANECPCPKVRSQNGFWGPENISNMAVAGHQQVNNHLQETWKHLSLQQIIWSCRLLPLPQSTTWTFKRRCGRTTYSKALHGKPPCFFSYLKKTSKPTPSLQHLWTPECQRTDKSPGNPQLERGSTICKRGDLLILLPSLCVCLDYPDSAHLLWFLFLLLTCWTHFTCNLHWMGSVLCLHFGTAQVECILAISLPLQPQPFSQCFSENLAATMQATGNIEASLIFVSPICLFSIAPHLLSLESGAP